MALTDDEKGKVREYLGYPQLEAATFYQLGTPRQARPAFVLEQNMLNLLPAGEVQVRALLAKLANSRSEIEASLGRLKASKLGPIELNGREMDQRKQHDTWLVRQLAAVLNVEPRTPQTVKVRIR
jgi:hypothetical protein